MNKKAIFGVFAVISLFVLASLSSAYDYTPIVYKPTAYSSNSFGTNYQYSAPAEQRIYPSYTYTPTITSNSASLRDSNQAYSNSYQGPIIERTNYYDESLDVKKANKFTKTISARTTERYIGAYQSENSNSNNREYSTTNYKMQSENPTSYSGGSYWRYSPSMSYNEYGRNSYTDKYYYSPRYDSDFMHYNWRY